MSSRVSPASSMAARQASRVRSSSPRPSRRPDVGLADARDVGRRSSGSVGSRPAAGRRRPEQRQPDVVVVFEGDLDGHADAHVLGVAARPGSW